LVLGGQRALTRPQRLAERGLCAATREKRADRVQGSTLAVAVWAAAFFVCTVCEMKRCITALRAQKRNDRFVNVHLDGKYAFGLTAIEAAHLRVGQSLTEEEIAALRKRDETERAYEKALNLLSYRPRSESEMRRRLRRKRVEPEAIESTIDRLLRAGLLDDREFARYWVDNRFRFRPRGARALRHELQAKGVPSSVISEALEQYDDQAAARKAAQAGARRMARLEPGDFRRRLSAYLARRGFGYEVVKPLVQEMLEQRPSRSDELERKVETNGE
jgi:regulatory protein